MRSQPRREIAQGICRAGEAEAAQAGGLRGGPIARGIIADVQRRARRDAGLFQRTLENPAVGFVCPDFAGNDDGLEMRGDSEVSENRPQAAIEIGNDGETVMRPQLLQNRAHLGVKLPHARSGELLIQLGKIRLPIQRLGRDTAALQHAPDEFAPLTAVIIRTGHTGRRTQRHRFPHRRKRGPQIALRDLAAMPQRDLAVMMADTPRQVEERPRGIEENDFDHGRALIGRRTAPA